jgi:ribokinase
LTGVSLFFVNEVEGEQLTGKSRPDDILEQARSRYPDADMVLTLGGEGAMYLRGGAIYRHGAYDVPVIDTTAAGDTFTGFFIAALAQGKSPEETLRTASVAAALAISRPGAEASIPLGAEVDSAELRLKRG